MLMTATVPAALGIAIVAIDGRTPDTIGIALASTWDAVACLACGTPARRVLTDGFKTGVQVRSHTYKRELEPVLKPCLSRLPGRPAVLSSAAQEGCRKARRSYLGSGPGAACKRGLGYTRARP